jgi:hypothetical protein
MDALTAAMPEARTRDERRRAAFEGGHALLQNVVGGVVEAVVMEPGDLEVQDGTRVLSVDEVMRDGLVDGHRNRSRAIRLVSGVNGDGLIVHGLVRSLW